MRLKSGYSGHDAENLTSLFNSVEFVCRHGDTLYFIDTARKLQPVFIDGFGIKGHKCTDPGIKQLPIFRPGTGTCSVEFVARLVRQGKMLPEALTIAVELSL